MPTDQYEPRRGNVYLQSVLTESNPVDEKLEISIAFEDARLDGGSCTV